MERSPPGGAGQDNPTGVSFTNLVGGINPFLSIPDPDYCVDFKSKRGYVMRKSWV